MTDNKERSRGWCFTINNYTADDVEDVNALTPDSKYMIAAKETGESGTEHIQGFVYYDDAKSFSKMKKLLKRAHIEKMKGTPLQAADYCKKDNNYIETGELPQKQGTRNDLNTVREMIKNGSKMKDVVDIATSYQSVKMAEQILKYNEKPRNWKPKVEWYYGSTGSGKTKAAYEVLGEECYTCLATGRWFEGYDGHENVLVDDMRKDFMKFHELLRFLDRYAYRVETKGGSRQFLGKNIIITSAYHPKKLFDTREDIQQLLRRIDVIKLFGEEVEEEEDYQLDE